MDTLLKIVFFSAALAITTYAKSAITCERRSMTLRCPNDEVLKINNANYGRQSRAICRHKSIHSTNCGRNVLDVVRSICQDRTSCTVESTNGLFGDTCQGTHKYLAVDYQCQDPTETIVIACERSSLTLNCPVNTGIYIASANYGRTGRHTCNRNPIERLVCSASNSKSVLESRCRSKRTCTVAANNSVFGDPCVGTTKYLQVRYGCAVA